MTTTRFKVGDEVEVKRYPHYAGEPVAWIGGYRVRSVEFEDYIVERNGQGFAIGSTRVRAAVENEDGECGACGVVMGLHDAGCSRGVSR